MATKPHPKGCIFVNSNSLHFYVQGMQDAMKIDLPKEAYDKMDIVNDEQFAMAINQRLTPGEGEKPNPLVGELLVVFLEPTMFFKDLTEDGKVKDIPPYALSSFESLVPFETTIAKTYDIANKTYAAVINAEVYYTLKRVFEAHGHEVVGAVPDLLVQGNAQTGTRAGLEGMLLVLRKFDSLVKNAMDAIPAGSEDTPVADVTEPSMLSPKKERSILPLVLPMFVLLLGVLGYMLYQQSQPPPRPVATTPTPAVVIPTVVPEDTVASESASATASADLTEFSIQVLNGSGVAGDATRVRAGLEEVGFEGIVTGNSDTTPEQTQVTLVRDVPGSVRQVLLGALQELSGDVTIREVATAQYDIIIVTSRPSGESEEQ
jgi:hypothetical protein